MAMVYTYADFYYYSLNYSYNILEVTKCNVCLTGSGATTCKFYKKQVMISKQSIIMLMCSNFLSDDKLLILLFVTSLGCCFFSHCHLFNQFDKIPVMHIFDGRWYGYQGVRSYDANYSY